jgi:YesN/AraC family two-component response regulator
MDAGNLPHLIISDIMMPVMDGFQLVEQLKNDTRYRPIPVIMLTARADIQDKLHALRIGVDDYLLKPFEEEELLVRIDTLLLRYRERLQWAPAEEEPEAGAPHSENEMAWLETLESLVVAEAQNDLLSVAWIADRLHLSERQFQRRLKKLTGLSPNAYLNEVRLQEARRLLEAGKVQAVKELAWAMSFRNEKYFARIFRERFGKNPSELLR